MEKGSSFKGSKSDKKSKEGKDKKKKKSKGSGSGSESEKESETSHRDATKILTEEEFQAKLEQEKEERRLKFIRDNFTFLHFQYTDGTKRTLQLERCECYMDIQVHIARYNPKGKKMFIIMDMDKERIDSQDFVVESEYIVKEIYMSKIPKFLPRMPTKWDFLKYHAAPSDWVDPVERRKLLREMESNRKRQEEERELNIIEREKEAKKEKMAEEAAAQEEWADLLGDL